MFQLWKLAVLCGLLTGTSASLLGTLDKDLNDVVQSVKPVLDEGLQSVGNVPESAQETLTTDLKDIQNSKVLEQAKQKIQEVGDLVENGISDLLSLEAQALGLKVKNAQFLDVKVELSPEGKGITMRVPIKADVSLKLPVIGKVVNLQASLDILNAVNIEKDAQTGQPKVVMGECASDPVTVQLTLLESPNNIINRLLNRVTGPVQKILSFLVQKEICPLLGYLSQNLSVETVQNAIGHLQQGLQQTLKP